MAYGLNIGALLLALIGGPAMAQDMRNCAPRDRVIGRLAERYGETRQSIGLGANNAVVEVFAASDTGTWTIILTLPNGLSCLVASGQAYEAVAEAHAAMDSDA